MDIRKIVQAYLDKHGHDGLVATDSYDGCGCGVDELAPCGEMKETCQAAVRVTPPPVGYDEYYAPAPEPDA